MSVTAAEGTGDDWAAVVDLHERTLRRVIRRRTADPDLVDDILQETYLRALRAGDHPVRAELTDSGWLRMLARRASVDAYRGARRRGTTVDYLSMVGELATVDRAMAPGSDEHLDALVSREAMRWAFRRLSPRQQRLLVMRGVDQLTYQEMAAQEQTSVEALASALNRARDRLRDGIERYESRDLRTLPAALLLASDLVRRVRDRLSRAQALVSPHLIELAGATLAIGIAAVVTGGSPSGSAPVPVVAGATQLGSATPADALLGAAVPDEAPSQPMAGGDAGPGAPTDAPMSEAGEPRELLRLAPEVSIGPEHTVFRYEIDLAPYTGEQNSEASVEFHCTRSAVFRPTCPTFGQVLPKELPTQG